MLWCWVLFGWLLPTLLLLPPKPGNGLEQRAQRSQGQLDRLAIHLEELIRGLLPSTHLQRQHDWWLSAFACWALLWVVLLLGIWAGCCLAAPLLVPAEAT